MIPPDYGTRSVDGCEQLLPTYVTSQARGLARNKVVALPRVLGCVPFTVPWWHCSHVELCQETSSPARSIGLMCLSVATPQGSACAVSVELFMEKVTSTPLQRPHSLTIGLPNAATKRSRGSTLHGWSILIITACEIHTVGTRYCMQYTWTGSEDAWPYEQRVREG
jgi:hypothetical protein